jgi:hypothetical protein
MAKPSRTEEDARTGAAAMAADREMRKSDLRGIGARTPSRTALIDEKYLKEKSPQTAARERRALARRTNAAKSREVLAKAKSTKPSIAEEHATAETTPEDRRRLGKREQEAEYKAPDRALSSKVEASSSKKKKRGPLRRIASAVGRGVGRGARTVARAVAGKPSNKQVAAKRHDYAKDWA